MSCTHMPSCELFVQFAMNPALELWQTHYCQADFRRCKRYSLSLSGGVVPLTLLPNGKMVRAQRSSEEVAATTLFNAVLKNRTHMISVLVRAGVDPDVRNLEGLTPLMVAAERGLTEIAGLLLENGADPHLTDTAGDSAYDMAVRERHVAVARLLHTGGARARAGGTEYGRGGRQ